MREIRVIIPKDMYMPGERIQGQVEVVCDESFGCNRIVVSLQGIEETVVTKGSGKHKRTYRDTHEILHYEMELDGKHEVYSGEKRYDFSFDLPDPLPPSYSGSHGWIRYALGAKVEVSWALDPDDTVPIMIPVIRPDLAPEDRPYQYVSDKDESWHFRVEGASDTVFLGETYRFRMIIGEEASLRKARVRLHYVELVSPDGYETTTYKLLNDWEVPEEEITRNMWLEGEMGTDRNWPAPFSSNLIRTEYWLQVAIDIPWRPDKVIEIPIKVWIREQSRDESDAFSW
jgi:hypothetical protein